MTVKRYASPATLEIILWRFTSDQQKGKKVNFIELEKLPVPKDTSNEIIILKLNEFYSIVGRKSTRSIMYDSRMAYDCNNCDALQIGPPKIIETTNEERRGYDLYCHNCDSQLESRNFPNS